MLDLLSGTDSSAGGDVQSKQPIVAGELLKGSPVETDTQLVKIEALKTGPLDGPMLTKFLMASNEWQEIIHALKNVMMDLCFIITQ